MVIRYIQDKWYILKKSMGFFKVRQVFSIIYGIVIILNSVEIFFRIIFIERVVQIFYWRVFFIVEVEFNVRNTRYYLVFNLGY